MSAPFAARLAQARALIARGVAPLPGHVADQMGAAGAEAGALHYRIGAALPILDPHRGWRRLRADAPSDDTRAYLLAALFGCGAVCPHLRKGGPRPAFVRLPLRRIDCERCTRTLRRPPADEDDRCDVCGARGVANFHPFAVRVGPTLVMGDACAGCAGGIDIVQEADKANVRYITVEVELQRGRPVDARPWVERRCNVGRLLGGGGK